MNALDNTPQLHLSYSLLKSRGKAKLRYSPTFFQLYVERKRIHVCH